MAKHPITEHDRLDPRAGDNDRVDTKADERDRVDALAGEVPTQFAAAYPIQTETAHAAEFILSEANGQRSRGNAYLAGAVTIKVAQPLKKTAPATSTLPATYVPAALGADCNALAIYGGTGDATNGLRIAVIERDAEVNGLLINWGAITAPEQALGIANLALTGIIVRV